MPGTYKKHGMPKPRTPLEREVRQAQSRVANYSKAAHQNETTRRELARQLQALRIMNALQKELAVASFTEAERNRLLGIAATASTPTESSTAA